MRSALRPDDASPQLATRGLTLGYDGRIVVDDLTVTVPTGQVTVVVGANACGKSTLLRGLARLLAPQEGCVLLDGHSIHRQPTKQVARIVGLLPQTPEVPDGITVTELVGRGRYPHQGWLRRWTAEDDVVVAQALAETSLIDLADWPVDELSGGQRQRVWIAMAIAQQPRILLLDEPTTFLDVSHQIEVLELLRGVNRRTGATVVIVLHDLNLAARYADVLVAMRSGQVVASGAPNDVVTEDLVAEVFGLRSHIIADPVTGTPLVVPIGRVAP